MLHNDTLDLFSDKAETPELQIPDISPEVGGVYRIWLSPTHYYVGRAKSFTGRWETHLKAAQSGGHGNAYFQACFDKYGGFRAEVLEECSTREERIAEEQKWLDKVFGTEGCVNLSPWASGGMSKGYIWLKNPNTRETTRVQEEFSEELLMNGWVPGMRPASESRKAKIRKAWATGAYSNRPTQETNPSSGTIWINDGTQNRRVSPDSEIPEGWVAGQLLHGPKWANGFTEEHRAKMSASQQRRWEKRGGLTDAEKQNLREKAQARYRANPEKWATTDAKREACSKASKGRKWLNREGTNRFSRPEEVSDLLAQGWVFGKAGKKPPKKILNENISAAKRGRVWVNFEGSSKMVPPDVADELIAQGWGRGRK